jgi:beta-glucosidase
MINESCYFFTIDDYTSYLGYGIRGGSAACAANSSALGFSECAGSSTLVLDPVDFRRAPLLRMA